MLALDILRDLDACGPALSYIGRAAPQAGLGRAASRLWLECNRGDWLIWLVAHKRIRPHLADSDGRLRCVGRACGVGCSIPVSGYALWATAANNSDEWAAQADIVRAHYSWAEVRRAIEASV